MCPLLQYDMIIIHQIICDCYGLIASTLPINPFNCLRKKLVSKLLYFCTFLLMFFASLYNKGNSKSLHRIKDINKYIPIYSQSKHVTLLHTLKLHHNLAFLSGWCFHIKTIAKLLELAFHVKSLLRSIICLCSEYESDENIRNFLKSEFTDFFFLK